MKVEGTVDTAKVGTYEVKYSYEGVTSVARITVKAIQTAVNVHDSTLYVGATWNAEDNFDSAIDKDGNSVDFKDVKVEGTVDTAKVGTYEVKYSYEGVTSVARITVKEKENLTEEKNADKPNRIQVENSNSDRNEKILPKTGENDRISLALMGGILLSLILVLKKIEISKLSK